MADINTTAASDEQQKQLVIINNSIDVFKTAPDVLKANKERSEKAVVVGTSIKQQWEAAWEIKDQEQMLKALAAADERSNKYLVNCRTALGLEQEGRAAITQMMDNFKRFFTETEALVDRGNKNSMAYIIQENRNKYAQKAAEIQKEKERIAKEKEEKKKEEIRVKADFEKKIFEAYNQYLFKIKKSLTDKFNEITLETYDERAKALKEYGPSLKLEVITGFGSSVVGAGFYKYHSKEEIGGFINAIVALKANEYTSNYIAELSLLRDELIDQLQSKFNELTDKKRLEDEAAELKRKKDLADEQEKERLRLLEEENERQRIKIEEEQRQREIEKEKELQAQASDNQAKEEEKISIAQQGEETMAIFETVAEIVPEATKQQTRTGYEIQILHPVAYTQIFMLWFENVGKDMPIDKLGGTKLDTMKKWCEKVALKGTKIDSKYLTYEETFTAVAKAEKKTEA